MRNSQRASRRLGVVVGRDGRRGHLDPAPSGPPGSSRASGAARTYDYAEFDGVSISGQWQVTIERGDAWRVSVEVPGGSTSTKLRVRARWRRARSRLPFSGRRLRLGGFGRDDRPRPLQATITMPALESLGLVGRARSCRFRASRAAPCRSTSRAPIGPNGRREPVRRADARRERRRQRRPRRRAGHRRERRHQRRHERHAANGGRPAQRSTCRAPANLEYLRHGQRAERVLVGNGQHPPRGVKCDDRSSVAAQSVAARSRGARRRAARGAAHVADVER